MKRRKEFNILNCSNTVLTAIVFYSLLIDAKDLPLMNVTDTMMTSSALNATTTDIGDIIATIPANENASTPSIAPSTLSTTTTSAATSMTFAATAAVTTPQNRTTSSSSTPLDMTADQAITLKPSFAAFVATAATNAPSDDTIKPLHSSSSSIGQFESSTSSGMASSLGQEEAARKTVNSSSSNISFSIRFTTMKPLIVPNLPDFSRHRVGNKQYPSKFHHDRHFGPFFEDPTNSSSGTLQVAFHQGTEAHLNCRVGMLKDKTVMWVRRTIDKVSLLTVGNVTYSGDPRIKVVFIYPNNWKLMINPISQDDAGLYMCQVSTHPPRVFATNLTVLAPAVRLVDEMQHEITDRYYKLGSSVDITCQVAISYLNTLPPSSSSPSPSSHSSAMMSNNDVNVNQYRQLTTTTSTTTTVFPFIDTNLIRRNFQPSIPYTGNHIIKWRKDGKELPKDIKINLSTTHTWRNSRISIIHAEKIHSGSYSCFVDNSTSSTVNIQILMGETPAAVQHNHTSRTTSAHHFLLLGFLITLYTAAVHISSANIIHST